MFGKRFFLIIAGTGTGLGAVLAVTPPHLGGTTGLIPSQPQPTPSRSKSSSPTSSSSPSTPARKTSAPTPQATVPTTTTPTPTLTQPAIPSAGGDDGQEGGQDEGQLGGTSIVTTSPTPAKSSPSRAVTPTPSRSTPSTPVTTPTPSKTTPPPSTGVTGTFTGNAANTAYGPVQVQIKVVDGKIVSASAPIYPQGSFRDQQINSQAIPLLIQETLAAQSSKIQGVGGASYTSQGWYTSLVSALAKAGL